MPPTVRAELARVAAAAPGDRALDAPAAAQRFELARRLPAGETTLPVERWFAAREHAAAMPHRSIATGRLLPAPSAGGARTVGSAEVERALAAWRPLGPGNVGGRTRAFLIDPRRPRTLYAAGVAGGVWKSVNAGASWRPIGDLLANIAVSSLAIDPADSNVLYAGTGEGYFNFDAVRGAGIFKSTNGGATWLRLAATDAPAFYFVNDLAVSARDPRRIYAATGNGVWRSADGGTTWKRILDPGAPDGCLDLALRTDRPNDVLFASCGGLIEGTVHRSAKAEGDAPWTRVLGEPGMGRTSLALAPSNQDVIYALASSLAPGDYIFGLHAVFRSTSGGAAGSWSARVRNSSTDRLSTLLLSNPVIAYADRCGFGDEGFIASQGWYDNVIAVDPKDPQRVFAGGIDLFRSDDGGASWGLASYWWEPTARSLIHPDLHAIVFHPDYDGQRNQIVYVAGDGGLSVTTNARARVGREAQVCDPTGTGLVWRGLNHGYEVTQFYHGAVYPDGRTYFGGTQDNGTVRGTAAGGRNAWREILDGDGGFVAVDPTDTNVLYAEHFGLSLRKSTDGGITFHRPGEIDDSALFIAPFALDPSRPQRIWTGGTRLWRSDDAALTWTRASLPVQNAGNSFVSALAVAPSNSDRVLAGLSEGTIHRSAAATSASDEDWLAARPREGFVAGLAIDPHDDRVAFATYSTFGGHHVWRTGNGGATWTPADGAGSTGLPDVPVHTIAIDPDDSRALFVGTDVGVFLSLDEGATWAVAHSSFANAPTEHLEIVRGPDGAKTLFAFTHGRGAWKAVIAP